MNKIFLQAIFLAQMIFLPQIMINAVSTATHPFEQLTTAIKKDAQIWADEVCSSLSQEQQLIFLNLFAFNDEATIPLFIKCAQYIESQEEMLPTYEKLGLNIVQIIQKYVEKIQEKITRKKDLTEKEEERLWQKLETKIQELYAYINQIYYKVLYSAVAAKKTGLVFCVFDNDGIIPHEKRTRLLPQSL
ncbi:MAG TPA: hypothetical protein VLB80_04785 [Candidatus Babeliales bacterium]|nr:hypothetical protein [Candidatus Babeliales bacterium]